MRRAAPGEVKANTVVLLTLHMSEARFREAFPVPFSDEHPLAAAEPSVSALIQTADGSYFGVMRGTITEKMEVEIADYDDPRKALASFLRHFAVRPDEVQWVRGSTLDPSLFSAR